MSHRNRKNRNGGRENSFNRNAEDRWFDEGGNVDIDSPQEREAQRSQTPGGYYSGRPNDSSYQYPNSPRHENQRGYRGEPGYRQDQGYQQRSQNWTTSDQRSDSGDAQRYGGGYGQSQSGYGSGYGQPGYSQPWYGLDAHTFDDSRSGSYQRGSRYGNYPTEPNYRASQSNYPSGSYGSSDYGTGYGQSGYGTGDYESNPEGPGQAHSVSDWGLSQPGGFFSGQQGGGYYSQPRGAYGREYGGRQMQQNYGSTFGGYESAYGENYTSSRQRYSNRGPKGYKRSDERIQDDVNDALSDGTIDASEITVQVQNGEVTLSGSVSDRRMKFYAESCAERVMGVTDVNNQLKITRSSSTTSESSRAGTSGSSSLRNNNDDAQSTAQRSTAKSTTTSAR